MFWSIHGYQIDIPSGATVAPSGPLPLEVPDPATMIDEGVQPGQTITDWIPQLGWFRGPSADTTFKVQAGQCCKTGERWTFWVYLYLDHVGTFNGQISLWGFTFPPYVESFTWQGGTVSLWSGLSPNVPVGSTISIRQSSGSSNADLWVTTVNGEDRQMLATDLTDETKLVCGFAFQVENPYIPEPSVLDSSSYYGLVTNAAPWLWWKMNEEVLRFAFDASGNGYTGTSDGLPVSIPAVTPDLVTGAAVDGSIGFASATATPPIPGSETFECWFYSDSPDLTQYICAQGTNMATAGYRALKLAGSTLSFIAINDSTETVTVTTGADAIAATQWYHAVGVVDDLAHQILLYLNGVLVGSAPSPSDHSFLTTQAQFTACRRADSDTSQRMVGRVDEFVRYARALTPEEAILRYQTVIG